MCWMKEKGWVLIPTSIFSCASFACLCVAVVTDHWLYASERLNSTNLFRNTTAGLWRKCVHDVSTTQVEWCERIDYFKHVERDGLAPTESVLLSLRKFAWFPLLSLLILLVGECCCVISQCNPQKNTLTLVAGIMFVIGGLFVLIGIVVFIGAVTEEASNSNKSRPSADDQMKVFHYRYGPSFILTIFSFISSESTGVLSVYLYISLYQLAYRKDRDHLEIPVDVNSEALAQVAGDQQLELENYRSLNMHLKNPLLSGHVYPDEEDDFSAEGVSPLVDSIGSNAALLDERGKRAGVGNSICSPTSTQRDFKSVQFLKRQGWKFKSNATSTAFPSDLETRKVPGADTSQGYPERFEHSQQFHYCQQQPKSSHQSKSVGNTTNASALTARSAASGLVAAILKHPTTENLQSIFHQSQQYTSQPLQPIQRRFQLLRQDSLHKQKPTKLPTKQSQQKAQPRAQQQLYNRHDWLTNSPSPTTLYKDTATQYSPLLSQAYNHNSFKTFDSASFRGKGVDKMSPEHRRVEEIRLRDVKTREEGAKLVERRDLNANQLDKCQQRWNSNNRPCCCQFQSHHQRRQHQNPGLYRLVSSSSKQLDINRSGRKNATQPEEISLVEAGLMARSAHYLPQCGLAEDWKESSVDRARSMHELRYFSYCNPQHLKSLVKPLLDDDSNFYFGRTTPV